jgi:hypothetical protein
MRGDFEVLHAVADPLERLKAMGRIYLDFAAKNPQLYDLMFISMEPMHHLDADCEEHWQEGNSTFQTLKNTIQQCQEMGYFAGHELEATSFLIWSTVHGMASLANAQRLTRLKFIEPDRMVAAGYDEFCVMLDRLR